MSHAPDPARVYLAAAHAAAPTDAELLRRFTAGGDGEAFAALVGRYGSMVLGVCRRVVGHAHDAEDAFQVTFLVLARKAAGLTTPDALGGWLYGVAYRSAMKVRTGRRREEVARARFAPAAQPAPPDDEVREVVDRAVFALPEKYRTAVVMCELQGVSRKDAAVRLGLTEGTLSSRLAAARRLLARRLGRAVATPAAVTVGVGLMRAATGAAPSAEVARFARAVEAELMVARLKFPAAVAGVVVAVGCVLAWQAPPPPGAPQSAAVAGKQDVPAGKPLLVLTGPDSKFGSLDGPQPPGRGFEDLVVPGPANGKVLPAANVRVSDADEWKKVWGRHQGLKPGEVWTTRGPALDIDFARCEVIAIFRGSVTNRRGITVAAVVEDATQVTIRYDDISFQTAGPGGGAVPATPYGFVLIPATAKTVVLERDAQRMKNQPPVWKEDARLKPPARKP